MILNAFKASKSPLNAAQLYDLLKDQLDKTTVYRGVKYLEEEHIINSFVFDCHSRGVERYYYDKSHHHFMHCTSCHSFIPMDDCPLQGRLEGIEEKSGFTVEEHLLTLKGTCRSCRETEVHQGETT